MKKITMIFIAVLLSSIVFAQHVKQSPYGLQKMGEMKLKMPEQSGAKVDTDTLFNIDLESDVTLYSLVNEAGTAWGYWTGHNSEEWAGYAETFTALGDGTVNGLVFVPAVVEGTGNVTFNLYDDNAGVPGDVLASEVMSLSDMSVSTLNDVTFSTPASISAGTFHIGYSITYADPLTDTIALYQQVPNAQNSFLINHPIGGWIDMPTATGNAAFTCAIAIGARVNITLSDPVANINPTTWAAGGVETGSSATSGTVTLTNAGAGTLTVTSITDLSGTPFSTTFVEGDVSLATDATYDFTFDFNPTAEGTFNETFEIVTNGGTVTVDLSGTGNAPISGDMDGGFETNVNDFDLTFSGWTQHDEDGSTTYSIQGATFTNQGYTGSFIAFNPTNTEPAQTWVPNTGSRAGVCFAATTPPNNDWLITPQSDVLNAGAKFQAYVQSITDQYGLERYAIWVSTTNTDIASFTKISAGEYVEAPIDVWTMVEYSLEDYVGEQVYVAIQCVSNDAFYFMIDDIVIDNPVSVANDIDAAVAVYPNPANNVVTIENAENAQITIVNMVGQVVASQVANSMRESINISDFSNGTYVIRIENGNEVSTQKLNIVR